jgi:acyl-CoA synthetase (AMP-forming)/AMP-acid ligase II
VATICSNLPEHFVLISPENRWKLPELRRLGQTLKTANGAWPCKVAIPAERLELLVGALINLQGRVGEILLLPRETTGETAVLMGRAGIETLWTGDGETGNAPAPADCDSTEGNSFGAPDCLQPTETRWILASSGTTGTRKLVAHNLPALLRGVRRTDSQGNSTRAPLRWGLTFDAGSFAGLQVVLQALFGGGEFVFPTPAQSFEERLAFFAREQVDALSATPSYWRRLLMAPAVHNLPLRQVTLGGEPADQKLLDALKAAFPQVRLRQIYASTEHGFGFSVNDGREGFPASWLREGTPQGARLNRSSEGHLLFARPEAASKGASQKWEDTGDLVEIVGDRVLFRGRADGRINVGGRKVLPESVERLLCSISGVALAQVYGKKNPFTGTIVAASIELESGNDPASILAQAKTLCRERLPAHEQPALLRVVPKIQLNANGKIARSCLPESS